MSLEIKEAKSKKNFKAFIITSEHFHSRLKTVEELSKLKYFLDKHFKQIKIICYLREQSSLFSSVRKQNVFFDDLVNLVRIRIRKYLGSRSQNIWDPDPKYFDKT